MTNDNAHILIIDDNEDILFMLKAMFQFKGYRVSIKDNVDDLENEIIELSPDLVLMDMLLSGADGCVICRQLKANPRIATTPVVMISAMPHADQRCLEHGADHFVGKPFEMDNMLSTIDKALSARR